ncbi:MAG: TVP38/TMEM64 family protein [Gammaproteobacteria bacterium]
MKRLSPIHLLIALNIVLILMRDLILPDDVVAAFAAGVETQLLAIGPWGYVGLVLAYVLCSFFFVPLLIPLNILGGALYGAYVGTAVGLVGITLGCVASTLSARYVFTGMQATVERRPTIRRLLAHADDHRNATIIMVRLAVVVPYLVQNIALALTTSSVWRLAALTAIGAIPGAAIYSLLGAGLVRADDASELMIYIALPILLAMAIAGAMAYFSGRYDKRPG